MLAIAIFSMGMAFESSRQFPSNQDTTREAQHGSGVVASEHSENKLTDWLLVLFNGLLFGSTLLLWVSTRKAANAAKSAAEALPRLERAYVFFISATSADFDEPPFELGGIPRVIRIKYRFKNSGRTPAILKRIQIGAEYLQSGFPAKGNFTYGDGKLPAPLIVGSDESPPESNAQARVSGTDYEWAKQGVGRIFFWGKLTYLDVFGASHETGICSEWHFGQSRFVVSDCDELNYYT